MKLYFTIFSLFSLISQPALSASLEKAKEYPQLINFCDNYTIQLGTNGNTIPVYINKENQDIFLNDVYKACITGGENGIAFAKENLKIKPIQADYNNEWSQWKTSQFLASTFNIGQQYGYSLIRTMQDKSQNNAVDNLLNSLKN